jgi:hypothetical protein
MGSAVGVLALEGLYCELVAFEPEDPRNELAAQRQRMMKATYRRIHRRTYFHYTEPPFLIMAPVHVDPSSALPESHRTTVTVGNAVPKCISAKQRFCR